MPIEAHRLQTLTALARKVLWLSSWTIHNANHLRESRDHRVVDGTIGPRWLQAFKVMIEDPIEMLV